MRRPVKPAFSVVVAVTAAAAIATAAATAAKASPAATTTARSAGPRLVDGQPTAVVILAVQRLDGVLRLVVVRHLDEAEASAPAGFPIAEDLGRGDRAELFKHFLKLFRSHRVLQIADV